MLKFYREVGTEARTGAVSLSLRRSCTVINIVTNSISDRMSKFQQLDCPVARLVKRPSVCACASQDDPIRVQTDEIASPSHVTAG